MKNDTVSSELSLNGSSRLLKLSYSYNGAGPGLSGTSSLEVNWGSNDVTISFIADKTSYENKPDFTFILPKNATWREITKVINSHQIYAFISDGDMSGDFAWPDRIKRSDTTIETDIFIVWGWAGPPLSDIVDALCFVDDSQSKQISATLHTLSNKHYSLEKISSYFHELDDPKIELKHLILRQKNRPIKISNLLKDRFNFLRIKAAEQKAKNDLEFWLIEPFKDEINKVLEKWAISNPASGNSYAIGHSIRKGAIKSYIRQYISQHGRLPTGEHSTEANFSNATIYIKFNMDDLM